MEKFGDAEQGKFLSEARAEPSCGQTTGRDPSLLRQTSEKLPPLDPP